MYTASIEPYNTTYSVSLVHLFNLTDLFPLIFFHWLFLCFIFCHFLHLFLKSKLLPIALSQWFSLVQTKTTEQLFGPNQTGKSRPNKAGVKAPKSQFWNSPCVPSQPIIQNIQQTSIQLPAEFLNNYTIPRHIFLSAASSRF